MSYSITVRAATKAAAIEAAIARFDAEVVAVQPIHNRERDAVIANMIAVVNCLHDDDTQDVSVAMSGYLCWGNPIGSGEYDKALVNGAKIDCYAGHVRREG